MCQMISPIDSRPHCGFPLHDGMFDIAAKNCAEFVRIGKEDDTESGVPFTAEELQGLWEYTPHGCRHSTVSSSSDIYL